MEGTKNSFEKEGFALGTISRRKEYFGVQGITENLNSVEVCSNPAWGIKKNGIVAKVTTILLITPHCGTTGINDLEQSSILNIYPNPANSILNIDISTPLNAGVSENTNIRIVNLLGETIATQQLHTGNNSIDVSSLISGVYFICSDKGGAVKFVKE